MEPGPTIELHFRPTEADYRAALLYHFEHGGTRLQRLFGRLWWPVLLGVVLATVTLSNGGGMVELCIVLAIPVVIAVTYSSSVRKTVSRTPIDPSQVTGEQAIRFDSRGVRWEWNGRMGDLAWNALDCVESVDDYLFLAAWPIVHAIPLAAFPDPATAEATVRRLSRESQPVTFEPLGSGIAAELTVFEDAWNYGIRPVPPLAKLVDAVPGYFLFAALLGLVVGVALPRAEWSTVALVTVVILWPVLALIGTVATVAFHFGWYLTRAWALRSDDRVVEADVADDALRIRGDTSMATFAWQAISDVKATRRGVVVGLTPGSYFLPARAFPTPSAMYAFADRARQLANEHRVAAA